MTLVSALNIFHDIWNFLNTQGILRAIVGWVVGYVMAHLVGMPRAWRKHMHIQDKIADRLDTETPGGLGDLVIDEVKKTVHTGHK